MRRIIRNGMEPTAKNRARSIGLGEANMTTLNARIAAPILMYHRIGAPKPGSIVSGQYVPPELFDKQLRFMRRRGYKPVSLTNFLWALRHPEPRVKPIAITFDDGYESVYNHGLETLKRNETTSTAFVVAGQVGETNSWDRDKGDVSECLMGIDQILDAQKEGME